ncbi:MAG: lactate utilization protein [Clostridia bacterium]
MNIDKTLHNLQTRGFKTNYLKNEQEALDYIKKLIPTSASVGFGGSMTVVDLNLHNILNERGNTVYHTAINPNNLPNTQLYKLSYSADWFVTSCNALTETGELIYIDGNANRIGNVVNGAPNVVVVAGINKITPDIASGIDRVRNVASPLNARRLKRNTPCATLNKCTFCNSPDCMCNATLILHHPTARRNFYIVLVDKSLGY